MWNKIQRIYIGTQKVRPPYPYTPTANTIAYFPFKDNQIDVMGNYLISTTGTKQMIWYSFTSPTDLAYNTQVNERFVWFWLKASSSTHCWIIITNLGWMRLNWLNNGQTTKYFTMKDSGGTFRQSSNLTISNDARHYIAFWINTSNQIKARIDGNQMWSVTYSPAIYTGTWMLSWTGSAIFSDLIIEDTMWTANQVTTYFNETKATYWIS